MKIGLVLTASLLLPLSQTLADEAALAPRPSCFVSVPGWHRAWINVIEVDSSDILHGELLTLQKGEKPFQTHRLLPHVAMTNEAMAGWCTKVGSRGSVYPEAYSEGRARWDRAAQDSTAFLCRGTLQGCIDSSSSTPR